MKLTKYLCYVLVIKDVSEDGICALAYFHKNSVTSCQEIKKDCDKKIVIIEKIVIKKFMLVIR